MLNNPKMKKKGYILKTKKGYIPKMNISLKKKGCYIYFFIKIIK